ncbi:MAG: RNA polymerase sigma factor [Pirellulales bacterium]|nr:RNA polymerase sigma factor [Pirellulales bacterium]
MNRNAATSPPTAEGNRHGAEGLESVFARWQDELLGTLFFLTGNIEDARDALQESFLKCWRRRAEFDQIDNPRAWVFQVTVNAGRDVRKTAWRRRRRPLDDQTQRFVSAEAGPATEAGRREELARVRQAILTLPDDQREVFLMRQNGQMTYVEIGHWLGVPEGTVKTRMRAALAKLRLALAQATG